jgi:hypothetical protein
MHRAVGTDEVHRLPEAFAGTCRHLHGRGYLEREVLEGVGPIETTEPANPAPAEAAVSVEDERRPARRAGRGAHAAGD